MQACEDAGMDQIPAGNVVKSVGMDDARELLQGVASRFLLGKGLEVAGNRAVLRDAVEVGFDLLDFGRGKEAARDGVSVLLERCFHFLQIHGCWKRG
jgi:hypothetical protein